MFAMIFDRDPLRLQDVPGELISWVQNWGGWAAVGLVLWLLIGYTRMRAVDRVRIPLWEKTLVVLGAAIAGLSYLPVIAVWGYAGVVGIARGQMVEFSTGMQLFLSICLTIGGAGAVFAVLVPVAANLPLERFRRIWALTRLSFKEAIRRRVLYAFSFLLLLILFASWFIPHRPEDELRSYVQVLDTGVKVILLVAAAILAAFSIPTDIRLQTIHTIITKPVERFEIVLGRFLGFMALMTLVLLVVTTISLVYVLRGIDPAAAAESLKAREPLYGELHYENTPDSTKAVNVGREWDYRSYITRGQPGQTPFAVWEFSSVPSALGKRKQVRCEFAFDIYRTTKGQENKGVNCDFVFLTANAVQGKEIKDIRRPDEYNHKREELEKLVRAGKRSPAEVDDELAEEFGYYEVTKEVTDFHTQTIDVPAGLFRNAAQASAGSAKSARGKPLPPLLVRVECRSRTQYVGMAKYDLYWRLDDPRAGGDQLSFAFNFYKGALGLWFRLCLVTGLAVALSTYLSGVISLLVTAMIYLGGWARDYIQKVGLGLVPTGGPMESFVRLARREVGSVPMEETTAVKVATNSDHVFRWMIRRVLDVIPDIDRYDLTTYVAEGFNIPVFQLLLDCGSMVLFLLPWMVLAYYLMKWREIAGPT